MRRLARILASPDASQRVVRLGSASASLAGRYTDYALEVLSHVQSIIGSKPRSGVLLQLVVPADGEGAVFAGLGALLRCAREEYPKLACQVVSVGGGIAGVELWPRLAAEADSGDSEVRYVAGERQVVRLAERGGAVEGGLPWREDGVYLITGGVGGLGVLFAKSLAGSVRKATVILVGRSAAGASHRALLGELGGSGLEVDYRSLDVRDATAVERLVAEIVGTYGRLTGVIHGAGVLRDSFVIRKTADELREVFGAKVTGVVVLDEATRDLELDFFVTFSSLSVLGSIGQADYAAANAFMDGYAQERHRLVELGRRHGRTLSVNWPYWSEGGMQIDAPARARMRQEGLAPLGSAAGLAAFAQALALDVPQIMVVTGHPQRMRQTMLAAGTTLPRPAEVSEEKPAAIAPDSLGERTIGYLAGVLSHGLKVPASRIEADESFGTYGIDSIVAMDLTGRLERTFGVLSKTLFFEYQSIAELAEYFLTHHRSALIGLFDPQGERTRPSAPPARPVVAKFDGRRQRPASRVAAVQAAGSEALDIAIIGLSGRYPEAGDVQAFWENLKQGVDCIREIPPERWPLDGFYHPDIDEALSQGKSYSKWGGFIDGVAEFDPLFFNISPREAEIMDPQERLFLLCVLGRWRMRATRANCLPAATGFAADGEHRRFRRGHVRRIAALWGAGPGAGPSRWRYPAACRR